MEKVIVTFTGETPIQLDMGLFYQANGFPPDGGSARHLKPGVTMVLTVAELQYIRGRLGDDCLKVVEVCKPREKESRFRPLPHPPAPEETAPPSTVPPSKAPRPARSRKR